MLQRAKITIRGVVQGVGFRPFVYRLANELNIKGWIINSSQGVIIDAEALNGSLEKFIIKLRTDKPKNSFIQSFEHSFVEPLGYNAFEIRESKESGIKTALVLPDIATCDDCLEEIFDPANRRYLYPFTNCTNCGPRYTIIKSLPYDRKNTTMAEFEMCPDCYAEYTDPLNRRFHAEPTACPKCGPQVELLNENGYHIVFGHEAIRLTAELLKVGKIVALKGIGGYQLLADAKKSEAINDLRTRKRRNEKPFALMFPDLDSVKKECDVSENEIQLLDSVEKPIVLLKRRNAHSEIAENAAIDNPYLGVMLPYSPLHHVLMRELGCPVIATSGNLSEEPICFDEKTALEKLSGIADYYLIHNRKILRHVDDSIARVIAGRQMLIRRARGYAPLPVQIAGLKGNTLAVGAHLKNTIAINNGDNVFISQHIGDLENIEAINAFTGAIDDLTRFYDLKPDNFVCDLHPDYVSTKHLSKKGEAKKLQHHYAHVLSCMAENEIDEAVLGISWDGTGYGTDGTIWGSEFLVSQGSEFKRAAHLKPFRLPGGESAIHEIWRIGFALLYEVFGADAANYSCHNKKEQKLILQMLEKGINSPVTASMGRLFDGVASILGIRQHVNYEAQGAMELEFKTSQPVPLCVEKGYDIYDFQLEEDEQGTIIINWHLILRGIVSEMTNRISIASISTKFHNTLVEIIFAVAKKLSLDKIVLTGGCFQNKFLLERAIDKLTKNGFKVYWHQRVPTNDGGISLGQMKYASLYASLRDKG